MMKKKASLFLAFLFLAYLLLGQGVRESKGVEVQNVTRAVGQMLVVGFAGATARSPGFKVVVADLEQGIVGGVLFLPQNIGSRSELEAMVRAIARCVCETPPLIAIDEEGGTVDRLGRSLRFPPTPSAAEIARMPEENVARQYKTLAAKLSDVGFNMNLAPVVDLNRNPRNPVIGSQGRSYSADPGAVEKYARIFIAEHRAKGLLTSLKHFPGHGSSAADTHMAPADIRLSWSPDELIPYRRLIETGSVDAVMVGHLANIPRWGGVATQQGATAISQLLRGDLKFEGVVISDDLTMRAVGGGKTTLAQIARSSVKGGVDLLLIGPPADASIANPGEYANAAIRDGLASGEIGTEAIQLSWQRIASLKAKLHAGPPSESTH